MGSVNKWRPERFWHDLVVPSYANVHRPTHRNFHPVVLELHLRMPL